MAADVDLNQESRRARPRWSYGPSECDRGGVAADRRVDMHPSPAAPASAMRRGRTGRRSPRTPSWSTPLRALQPRRTGLRVRRQAGEATPDHPRAPKPGRSSFRLCNSEPVAECALRDRMKQSSRSSLLLPILRCPTRSCRRVQLAVARWIFIRLKALASRWTSPRALFSPQSENRSRIFRVADAGLDGCRDVCSNAAGALTCLHHRHKGCNVVGTQTHLYGRDDLIAGDCELGVVALEILAWSASTVIVDRRCCNRPRQ